MMIEMQTFNQSKIVNNLFFIILLFLFFMCLFINYSFLKSYLYGILLFIWFGALVFFMIFSGPIYGFITHMKVKAVFLGLSCPVIAGLSSFTRLTMDYFDPISNIIRPIFDFFVFVLIGLLCGFSGFFAANTESNKNKKYFFYLISLACLILGCYLFLNPPNFLYFLIVK
ncbi:MAG: hypothetical protein LBU81_01405 [Methanosarcinales archaeon]|jgi:hypothetical protein|nr:hypothetical protein [Methanosarcinales archaeon]